MPKPRKAIFPTAQAKDRHHRAILRYFAKAQQLPPGMLAEQSRFGPKLLYAS